MQTGFRRSFGLAILALVAGCLPAYGQVVSGTIVGTVHDPSGAAIPATAVVLRNVDTNQTRESTTNEVGSFTFATLPPGRYRVSTTHPGFKSAVTSDIDLQIDQTARVDLTLEVGQVSEEVTVSAAAVALQTDTATMGQVIAESRFPNLPLNGRNFLDLANLSAGVVPVSAAPGSKGGSADPELTTHVAGIARLRQQLPDRRHRVARRAAGRDFVPAVAGHDQGIQDSGRTTIPPSTAPIPASSASPSNPARTPFMGRLTSSCATARWTQPQYFDQGRWLRSSKTSSAPTWEAPSERTARSSSSLMTASAGGDPTRAFAVLPDPQYLTGNFGGSHRRQRQADHPQESVQQQCAFYGQPDPGRHGFPKSRRTSTSTSRRPTRTWRKETTPATRARSTISTSTTSDRPPLLGQRQYVRPLFPVHLGHPEPGTAAFQRFGVSR